MTEATESTEPKAAKKASPKTKSAAKKKTNAKKATAKPAAGFPFNGLDSVKMPDMDSMRDAVEESVDRVKDGYEAVRDMTRDSIELFGDTISTATSGMTDFNLKLLEIAQSNADRGFAVAKKTVKANTISDVIEIQRDYAQSQFKAYRKQAEQLRELGTKIVEDTVKPLQKGLTTNFEKVRDELRAA